MATLSSVAKWETVWRWCTRAAMAKAWSATAALPSAVVQRSSSTPSASSILLLLASGRSSMSKGITDPTSTTLILFLLGMQIVSKAFKEAWMALGYKSSRNILARASSTRAFGGIISAAALMLQLLWLCDWSSVSNDACCIIAANTVAAFTLASKLLPLHKNQAMAATDLGFRSSRRCRLFVRRERMARASSLASRLKTPQLCCCCWAPAAAFKLIPSSCSSIVVFRSCIELQHDGISTVAAELLLSSAAALIITEASTETATSDSCIHLRVLSLSRASDLMFLRVGKGSAVELRSWCSMVATVSGTHIRACRSLGVARIGTTLASKVVEPASWVSRHQLWMRRRSVWLGTSSKDDSFCMVAGQVWFPAFSQSSMLLRS